MLRSGAIALQRHTAHAHACEQTEPGSSALQPSLCPLSPTPGQPGGGGRGLLMSRSILRLASFSLRRCCPCVSPAITPSPCAVAGCPVDSPRPLPPRASSSRVCAPGAAGLPIASHTVGAGRGGADASAGRHCVRLAARAALTGAAASNRL